MQNIALRKHNAFIMSKFRATISMQQKLRLKTIIRDLEKPPKSENGENFSFVLRCKNQPAVKIEGYASSLTFLYKIVQPVS